MAPLSLFLLPPSGNKMLTAPMKTRQHLGLSMYTSGRQKYLLSAEIQSYFPAPQQKYIVKIEKYFFLKSITKKWNKEIIAHLCLPLLLLNNLAPLICNEIPEKKITGRCLYLIAYSCAEENLHLYVHALARLGVCAFISACDLDVVNRRLLLRRIISTHQFSSRVPMTLSCWRHVLFSLFLMFSHRTGKQTPVYLSDCYKPAGNLQLPTDLQERHPHKWCNRVGWGGLAEIIYLGT